MTQAKTPLQIAREALELLSDDREYAGEWILRICDDALAALDAAQSAQQEAIEAATLTLLGKSANPAPDVNWFGMRQYTFGEWCALMQKAIAVYLAAAPAQQPKEQPCPECKCNYPLHDLDCKTGPARANAKTAQQPAPAQPVERKEWLARLSIHVQHMWDGAEAGSMARVNYHGGNVKDLIQEARAAIAGQPAAQVPLTNNAILTAACSTLFENSGEFYESYLTEKHWYGSEKKL